MKSVLINKVALVVALIMLAITATTIGQVATTSDAAGCSRPGQGSCTHNGTGEVAPNPIPGATPRGCFTNSGRHIPC